MANENQTKKHRVVNKKVIVTFTIFAQDSQFNFTKLRHNLCKSILSSNVGRTGIL